MATAIARVVIALSTEDLQVGRLIRLLEDYEDDTDGGIYAVFPSDRYLLPKVKLPWLVVLFCSDEWHD